MAFYSVHHAYVSNSTNSIESVQDLISNISRQLDELAQKRGDVSNGVKWSSFGEPTPPAHVEYSVQVPTQDDFDDIEKLILLTLEFTWSAQDDPIRKVILEEMKKIKSGKELVEEVRKIEKNINAGGTISSLLELSVAGISVDTCEVPIPSHSLEKDSIRQEEERPQSEDVLEAKAQNDPKLEFPSDQVEEPSSLTLEEVQEAIVLEDEELEIHLPIVIQECDVTGFCLCTIYYMLTRFEVTFLGTLVDSKHGEEEKQGAHRKKSDGGACTRKQRRRAAVGEMIERVLHHASPDLLLAAEVLLACQSGGSQDSQMILGTQC
ncbi:hypothetical protein D1007_61152 [Hordeum vulgare]|nr:hypothetical protein D1007_61152 [Hordeum vulgare]